MMTFRISQNNFFEDGISVWEYYVEGSDFGIQTMSSNSFGNIVPQTSAERVASIFIMIIGASVMGNLFGFFAAIIEEMNY